MPEIISTSPSSERRSQGAGSKSFGAILRRAYDHFPDRTALSGAGHPITYEELGGRVCTLGCALLELGLVPGDRVVLVMENRPEVLEVEQALFTHGLVRVALSFRLRPAEIRRVVADSTARAIVTTGERATALTSCGGIEQCTIISVDIAGHPPVLSLASLARGSTSSWACPAPRPADLAAILYTSGTTGEPKGVMLTHGNWAAMVRNLLAELPVVEPGDTVLHVAPLSHFSGSVGAAYTAKGAAMATMAQFDPPAVLRTIQEGHASVVPLVPTMLKRLVVAAEQGNYDVTALRAIPYGGSAISPAWAARAYDAFGEVLVQMYGLSEILIPISALSPSEHSYSAGGALPERLGTAGHPSPFVEVRVVDECGTELQPGTPGEVLVRGETVMAGYWGHPEATAEVIDSDGWAHTGDIGVITGEGYLRIIDRSRDVIISGGFNVYPAEVERVLETMPGIREVAVIGVPDAEWGEAVKALIVPSGERQPTFEEVRDFCRSQLAGYKVPRSVDYVGSLPKTDSGKVMRRSARDSYWAGQDRKVGE